MRAAAEVEDPTEDTEGTRAAEVDLDGADSDTTLIALAEAFKFAWA